MRSVKRFSYFPLPFIIFVQAGIVISVWAVLFAVEVKNAYGLAAIVLYTLLSLVTLFFLLFAHAYFKRPWRYELDDHKLVADRLWGRHRVEIPWSEITRVSKATRKGGLGNWPEIEVHARDGTRIVIPSNLGRYTELVEIIRQRATGCSEFDVYPAWRLGARAQ